MCVVTDQNPAGLLRKSVGEKWRPIYRKHYNTSFLTSYESYKNKSD